ncbi:MAG: hypothetical protein CL933_20125 [Deltaproteobacteria bacterium]|nr:hypothetical protein [Deltaproteobacteria bacterium]
MSLVGNLEDLSLGDILQIISLSRKSGVLALACDHGSGRIVFREGLVEAGRLKGDPNDLRELLVSGGFIDPAGYDASVARSRDQGKPMEETLASEAGLTTERIETLIRDSVEAAILEMFTWPAGDFSFDVRTELDPDDPKLILSTGLNAQYIAMEGLRLGDERARDSEGEIDPDTATSPPSGEPLADPTFGLDALDAGLDGDDVEMLLEDERVDDDFPDADLLASDPVESVTPLVVENAADALVTRVVERAVAADELADLAIGIEPPVVAEPPPESPPVTVAKKLPVVLIEPDVMVLDWVKASIQAEFARVHVFQKADQGLSRIRQYLIRGEAPFVLISLETQIDPLSGIRGLGDFVKRLKVQAPRSVVLGLRDDDEAASPVIPAALDGLLVRPARHLLAERNEDDGVIASQTFLRALTEYLGRPGGSPPP